MFCTNCGSPLREGQKFCENCGAPVPQAQQAAVQTAPQVQAPVYPVRPNAYDNTGYSAGPGQAYSGQAYSGQTYAAPSANDKRARSITGCGAKFAILRFFHQYCEFSGRSSRSEYWWPFLMNWAISIVAGWLGKVSASVPTIVFLALLLPGLGVFVRREHDIGRRWTRIFVALIPVVGVIMLLVDMVKPGEGPNRFGPAPVPYSEVEDRFDI